MPANDLLVYPLMLELAACLRAEYAVNGVDTMSEVAIVAGEFIPVDLGDECDRVSGFVQLVTSYPSEGAFPSPEPGAQVCGTSLAFQLYVGVMRCGPTIANDGTIDTVEYNEWTRLQLSDMAAVKRAVQCCYGAKFEETEYALIDWTPVELQGDIGGGRWQVVTREMTL